MAGVFKPKTSEEIMDSLRQSPNYVNFHFLNDYYEYYGEERFNLLLKYVGNLPSHVNLKRLIDICRDGNYLGPYDNERTVQNMLHILKLFDFNMSNVSVTKKGGEKGYFYISYYNGIDRYF